MNSNTAHLEVLAATALVGGAGSYPARIVLCRVQSTWAGIKSGEPEYIVWMEVLPENEAGESGAPYFVQGDYTHDATEAWEHFTRRSQRHLTLAYEVPVELEYGCSHLRLKLGTLYLPKATDATLYASAKVKE